MRRGRSSREHGGVEREKEKKLTQMLTKMKVGEEMMEKGKRRRRDGVVGKRKQSGEQWKEKTEKRGQRKGKEEKEGAVLGLGI